MEVLMRGQATPPRDITADVLRERAAIDERRSAQAASAPIIGPSLPRYEARDKVTGRARYANDVSLTNSAYAYMVQSAVARGSVVSMDVTEAERLPGVLRIYDYKSMAGRFAPLGFRGSAGYGTSSFSVLQGPEIVHEGQIVGMVVAESYEAARDAAHRVKVVIRADAPSGTFGDEGLRTRPLTETNPRWTDPVIGDADAAFAAAPLKIEAEYGTPTQHHNSIELFSTTCAWEDGRLTIHEPSIGVHSLRFGVAQQLGLAPDDVHVVCPFVGGSFGSNGYATPRTAIVALAARDLDRPVRCVMTRKQGFTISTHRAETRHSLRLACAADGKLTAYGHDASELTSRTDDHTLGGPGNTVHMYACPNIKTKVWTVAGDRNTPGFMRAPHEMPYMFALEGAMDEMAERAGIDPVRFRQLNDTQVSSFNGRTYTSRSLIQCLDQGAATFGWNARDPRPGSMRDGDWLVGYGVATASYGANSGATSVRLEVSPDGVAEVEVAAHDVGQGAYSVAALITAQELGLDIDKVRVRLGDSRLPIGPLAGAAKTTAVLCNSIALACARLRERLDVAAGDSITTRLNGAVHEERFDWFSPGTPAADVGRHFQGYNVIGGHDDVSLRRAFGAEFVEVRVHARTREIRVPRITGAFAAGRIMNARTARSQLMGGMIWGIGSALHEATEIDRRAARYVNDNIAEYLIAVNADIPSVEVIMVPEEDRLVNALGIKGVGELSNVGTAAAIANAVYHATGTRVRDLPIRIEHVLPA